MKGGDDHLQAGPPAGGDAGHNDALWSRCGHSLECPLPELLKQELLLQLLHIPEAAVAAAALRPTEGQ